MSIYLLIYLLTICVSSFEKDIIMFCSVVVFFFFAIELHEFHEFFIYFGP